MTGQVGTSPHLTGQIRIGTSCQKKVADQLSTLTWDWNKIKMKTFTWNSSVALLSLTCFQHFPLFRSIYFSHRRSKRIKKFTLQKLTGAPKNLGVDTFLKPHLLFWGPLADILDSAGGAALQALTECPQCR